MSAVLLKAALQTAKPRPAGAGTHGLARMYSGPFGARRSRELSFAAWTAAALLLWAAVAEAQVAGRRIQIKSSAAQPAEAGGSAVPRVQVMISAGQGGAVVYPGIAGYYLLRLPHVQEELEMLDEQKEKLEQINRQYYDQVRQGWTGLRNLSAEDRKRRLAEIQQENRKRQEELRRRTEEVLLPHQLDRLEEIAFRMRAPAALANPRILDQLGATEAQKGKLRRLRGDMQAKIRQLQEEMLDAALEVLGAEQREKIRAMYTPGFKPN